MKHLVKMKKVLFFRTNKIQWPLKDIIRMLLDHFRQNWFFGRFFTIQITVLYPLIIDTPDIYFFLFLGENGEILEAAQKAEAFIKELEDMQNSVVSNDSPILSSNVKSLQDLKAESPNKKLDRESLKQVSLIYVTYCEDTKFEKK